MKQRQSGDYLLEKLPARLKREWIAQTSFAGLARTGKQTAGTVADMKNLSPRCAPALATRHPRGIYRYASGITPHGMVMFGDMLYYAQGSALYRSASASASEVVGVLSDTDKQFAVFGDRLFIFPDKMYVDGPRGSLHPMTIRTSVYEGVSFSSNRITLPAGNTWASLGFEVGDGLHVGNADDVNPAPEGNYAITALRGEVAEISATFLTTYISRAIFERRVPDMDGLCTGGDRLFGFHGKDIYVSAAGNALNWNGTGITPAEASATLHTDSEGDFTACAPWQGYVIFFKSDRICKLLGHRSDSLTLSDAPAPGIPPELAKTLCEVGGALYYHARSGVYRYSGQYPERIGHLTATSITFGCGGTDGLAYYLAIVPASGGESEDGRRLYVYTPETGVWYAEDDIHVVQMVNRQGFLCMQDDVGGVWLTASDGRQASVARFESNTTGAGLAASVTLEPRHIGVPIEGRLVRLCLRASAEAGATLRVLAAFGDGRTPEDADFSHAVELAQFTGAMKDRILRVPLPARVCDSVVLKLDMSGRWEIFEIAGEVVSG